MPGSERLGDVLRGYRRRAGLTQQEAADLAGLSVAGLRDVEQGRVLSPRPQNLRRLAVALELTPAEIEGLLQLGRGGRERTDAVWIGVLGPLQLYLDGSEVDLGSETQRALLGLLALSANRPITRELLIERLWGADPPATAAEVLPTRISRLRRRLQPADPAAVAPTLVATSGGYQLTIAEEQLDLLKFRALVRQARQQRTLHDLARAHQLYADAVKLWRGQVLSCLSGLFHDSVVVGLNQEWQAVVLEYAAVADELGQHDEVVPLLRRVVADNPLHEAAHARLLVALAGAGQQAEALSLYESVRRRLVDELGTDPGPELTAAHRRVLRQEISQPEAVATSAYRQLPPDIVDFSGREVELRHLHRRLPISTDGATAVTLLAIQGMAGVGKTRLAVHFAHQLLAAGRYADQQLYVDLQGHADQPPAEPAAVLASFLHLLGVPGNELPADLAGRSALFRDRLYGKNALLLLDNAADEEQIAPLLPASPTNLVLVTSRRALALDGAHTLPLDAFTPHEARTLLRTVVGDQRVDDDPAAADRVIELCGRLPLAVSLAARRLQARPAWTLSDVADRLADRRNRLTELAAGTRRMQAVFDLSYRTLPTAEQRFFRRLGLHPGQDFTEGSAAALTGTTPEEARQILNRLVDEHLVGVSFGSRYRLHDLLREYARDLAHADGKETCRQAVERLLEWYVAAADAAQQLLFPDRRVLAKDEPRVPHHVTFDDDDSAFRWLAAEHANLLAAVTTALEYELWQAGWKLPATLRHYFERTCSFDDWLWAAEAGLTAAERGDDLRGRAVSFSDLGAAHGQLGDLDRAITLLQHSLTASRAIPDREHELWALNNLGVAHGIRGQLPQSVEYLEQALALVRDIGGPNAEARVLTNLGLALREQGAYQRAVCLLQEAMELQRQQPNSYGLAQALFNLGMALLRNQQYEEAVGTFRRALDYYRRAHARAGQASTLELLGDALSQLGQTDAAQESWKEARVILAEMRDPRAEALHARLTQPVPVPKP
jgi:DNA-binding SARP family transcriptional activator/Flp pilus assembly protein TadD/DNA-binding XRE family transcriptional regulator